MKFFFTVLFFINFSLFTESIELKNGNIYTGLTKIIKNNVTIDIREAVLLKSNIKTSIKLKSNPFNKQIPELAYLILKDGNKILAYLTKQKSASVKIVNNTYFNHSRTFNKDEYISIHTIVWANITLKDKTILTGQIIKDSKEKIHIANIISPENLLLPKNKLRNYDKNSSIKNQPLQLEKKVRSDFDSLMTKIELLKKELKHKHIKNKTNLKFKHSLTANLIIIKTLGAYSEIIPNAYALSMQSRIIPENDSIKIAVPILYTFWKNIFKPGLKTQLDLIYFNYKLNSIKAINILAGPVWYFPLWGNSEQNIVLSFTNGIQLANFKSENESKLGIIYTLVPELAYEFAISSKCNAQLALRLDYNYDPEWPMYSMGIGFGAVYNFK